MNVLETWRFLFQMPPGPCPAPPATQTDSRAEPGQLPGRAEPSQVTSVPRALQEKRLYSTRPPGTWKESAVSEENNPTQYQQCRTFYQLLEAGSTILKENTDEMQLRPRALQPLACNKRIPFFPSSLEFHWRPPGPTCTHLKSEFTTC